MNILAQVNTWNHISYYNFLLKISEQFPQAKFGITGGSKLGIDFFKNQKKLKNVCFFDENPHEFSVESLKDEFINFKDLEKFESLLEEKSIWKLVSSDRRLGRKFQKGFRGYNYKNVDDPEIILKRICQAIRQTKNIFEKFKPDYFFPAYAMGDINVKIYKKICSMYKTKYVKPDILRLKNYITLTESDSLMLPEIEKDYNKNLKLYPNINLTKAETLYKDLILDLKGSSYFDAKSKKMDKMDYAPLSKKIKLFIYTFPKIVFNNIKNAITKSKTSLKGDDNNLFFNFIEAIRQIKIDFLILVQRVNTTGKKFGTLLNKKQKYVYYPLAANPEYNSLGASIFENQLFIIEVLSKSIPSDCILYVKEHPAMAKFVLRKKNFYDDIKEIPNVKFAPLYQNSSDLIKNSELVVLINGTSGWEAILQEKPLITLSDFPYNILGLSEKCSDIEKLSVKIKEQINSNKKISPEERKKRLILFLDAAIKNGFELSYPADFFYTEVNNEEKLKISGHELYRGFMEYLNKNRLIENEKK